MNLMGVTRWLAKTCVILHLSLALTYAVHDQRYKTFPCLSDCPSLDSFGPLAGGGVTYYI